jgi:seryl-tRNA synthetase
MLSLRFIREHPDLVKKGIARKHEEAPIDDIVRLDEERRRVLQQVETLRARRNEVSQAISRMPKKPPELINEMRHIGDEIKKLDSQVGAIETELQRCLLLVPNMPHNSVPEGASDEGNTEIRRWGQPRAFEFAPSTHWDIAERLGIADFERGVKVSGSRFFFLRGLGARLERALISWMLDLHTQEHGYLEIAAPFLVRRESMVGTGQLPKFEEESYHCDTDDLFLIPTGEVPVTNIHRDEILEASRLPVKYVCHTACFRREAGAAGSDTRGMIRVHQFNKVELVKFVEPTTSYQELDKLMADACSVLERLELPYRIVQICTGDLGFTAAMKFDPEVWMAAQKRFVEISSCSNFEDFQARRANIRYRPAPTSRPEFVHTLNGSALAIGRTVAAVLESYQNADGSVTVPEVLRSYIGADVIRGPL